MAPGEDDKVVGRRRLLRTVTCICAWVCMVSTVPHISVLGVYGGYSAIDLISVLGVYGE